MTNGDAGEVEETDDIATRRAAAIAVIEQHPDALSMAYDGDARVMPWPEGLPRPRRTMPRVRSLLDLVVRADHSLVVKAWFTAHGHGTGVASVRLASATDRVVRLIYTDLRASDGVIIGVIIPEAVEGEVRPLGEIIEPRPRTVVLRQGRSGEYLDWNEQLGRFNGWTRELFLSKHGLDLVHPDDHAIAVEAWLEMLDRGTSQPRRWRSWRPDGAYCWVEVSFENHLDDAEDKHVRVTATDITEEVAAREALEAQELVLNRVMQVVPVGLFQVQPNRAVTYANDRLRSILGTAPGDSLDALLATVVATDRARVEAAVADVLASGTDHDVEVEVHLPARARPFGPGAGEVVGEARRCGFAVRALVDRVGAVVSAIVCVSDVTETARRLLELELDLVHHAYHDPVTGLANRTQLLNRVEEAIAQCRITGDVAALLLVDIDEFKAVNDTLGHSAGDDVLRTVSDRLRALGRPGDVIARVGADEFAVLVEEYIDPAHPRRLAEQILATCAQPVEVDGRPRGIGVSIGIATTATGGSREELVRDADLALHRAKANGRHRYEIFAPEMHAAAVARVELEANLRQAIEGDQLLVVYQPIHDLATGAVTSVEALVRWRHPTRGMVAPADFVPLAEETGLIVDIGRWVLGQACEEAAGWDALVGEPAPRISVNLSARQLESAGLLGDVAAATHRTGLPPDRLVLEITESLLIAGTDSAFDLLADLRARGVSLAIDDFGTGYSSLAYLERLPCDIVKIDKAFVDRVAHGGRHAKLINGVLGLGRDLGLVAVAEGIETSDQLQALQSLRCPAGQGYLFSRPLEAPALRAYLTAGRAVARTTLSTSADAPLGAPSPH